MWVVLALVVGLLAVVGLLLVVLITRRRRHVGGQTASELRPDQFMALGMIFTGTGVATTVAVGF
jgi:hypothetical protein